MTHPKKEADMNRDTLKGQGIAHVAHNADFSL